MIIGKHPEPLQLLIQVGADQSWQCRLVNQATGSLVIEIGSTVLTPVETSGGTGVRIFTWTLTAAQAVANLINKPASLLLVGSGSRIVIASGGTYSA